jgi:hypothetical protein
MNNPNNSKKNIYNYEEERYRLFPIDSHESTYKRFQTTHQSDYISYKFIKSTLNQKEFSRKMSKPKLRL